MAQPNLDFFDKRALLVKAETTEGTDASPTGTLDGFRVMDGVSSTEFDKDERKIDRSFFGGHAFSVANKRAKIEGTFELYPPATPGAASTSDADCGKILLPSGMTVTKTLAVKTTRYNPISASIPSVTAYWYHVRRLIKVLGARGDISALTLAIGKRFTGKCSITGSYTDWTPVAMPTVTLPTTVPVVASHANSTLLLGTITNPATSGGSVALADLHAWGKELTINFGNALSSREYTEKKTNGITDRAPTFTLKLASTDITNDFDPLYVRDKGTLITAAFKLSDDDTKDGLYSALSIRGQIDQVTETSIDGDDGWEITGPCIPSDTGGDEFYIEFGDDSV